MFKTAELCQDTETLRSLPDFSSRCHGIASPWHLGSPQDACADAWLALGSLRGAILAKWTKQGFTVSTTERRQNEVTKICTDGDCPPSAERGEATSSMDELWNSVLSRQPHSLDCGHNQRNTTTRNDLKRKSDDLLRVFAVHEPGERPHETSFTFLHEYCTHSFTLVTTWDMSFSRAKL